MGSFIFTGRVSSNICGKPTRCNVRENLYRIAFTLLLVALALVIGLNAQEVRLDAPKFALAGASSTEIRVQWRIERHEENRKWTFVMNSTEGDYQLSEGELWGVDSPAIFPICTAQNQRPCLRRVRAGFYVLQVCVYRFGKKPICDRRTLEVK